MFIVYHSNCLIKLNNLIIEFIANHPLNDPFDKEIIVVPNLSTIYWLKIKLVNKLGVTANVDFLYLSKLISKIFSFVSNEEHHEYDYFFKESIIWDLMSIMPNLLHKNEFFTFNQYLKDDFDHRKCFALIKEIVNLFKKYLLFFPNLLHNWSLGNKINNVNDSFCTWQYILWNKLIKKNLNSLWCEGDIYLKLKKLIRDSYHFNYFKFPSRIIFYGIDYFPYIYLKIFKMLSKYLDIHIFIFNPCCCYHQYNDIFLFSKFNNPLVYFYKNKENIFNKGIKNENIDFLNHNKKKKNFLLSLWGEITANTIYFFNKLSGINSINYFVIYKNTGLLNNIKNDILLLKNNFISFNKLSKNISGRKLLDKNDDSLNFYVCKDKFDEVRLLYNKIIFLMRKNPLLSLQDILVASPCIEEYMPIIYSIFDNDDIELNSQFNLNFNICVLKPKLIFNAFFSLIRLPFGRYYFEEVISFLEIISISSRFNINKEELMLLRKCSMDANIKWGLDKKHVNELGFSINDQNTWELGISRMLLGYIMDNKIVWNGVSSYNNLKKETAYLVGNLAFFLSKLYLWRFRLKKLKTIIEWNKCLNKMIDDFFSSNNETERRHLLIIRQKLYLMSFCCKRSDYTNLVSIKLIDDNLSYMLNSKNKDHFDLFSYICFCNILSLPAMSFKIIYLLGMNDNNFPYSNNISSVDFNFMNFFSTVDNYLSFNNNCYFFLKLIFFTSHKLYISFVDYFFEKKNFVSCCSVVIKELVEYISNRFYLMKDIHKDIIVSSINIRKHLYKISCNLINKKGLLSYSYNDEKKYFFINKKNNIKNNFVFLNYCHVLLQDLLNFYYHPIKFWFHKYLSVYFLQEISISEINEPFIVSNKFRYLMRINLFKTMLKKENVNDYYRYLLNSGNLPYGSFGEVIWEEEYEKVKKFFSVFFECYLSKKTCDMKFFLDVKGFKLHGIISDIRNNSLFRYKLGSLFMKDYVLLWIEHLVYCAMGGVKDSCIVGLSEKRYFIPINKNKAKEYLYFLIVNYFRGCTEPQYIFYRSGGEWIKCCYDNNNKKINYNLSCQQKARNRLIQEWFGNQIILGEYKDMYLKKIVGNLDDYNINKIINAAEKYFLLPLMFSYVLN